MMLRAENARVARMLAADDRAAEAERQLRAAEARAEARAAEAERKLRAAEARAAEERRQRAAEDEAERQRRARAKAAKDEEDKRQRRAKKIDLSKLALVRTLEGHSDCVRCGVHCTFCDDLASL